MINCEECPFLYHKALDEEWGCTLSYTVNDAASPDADGAYLVISADCQLELAQYAVKDKRDSITFVPKETNEGTNGLIKKWLRGIK